MKSYWMIRLFTGAFVGCLMVYVLDPVDLSTILPEGSTSRGTTSIGNSINETRVGTTFRSDRRDDNGTKIRDEGQAGREGGNETSSKQVDGTPTKWNASNTSPTERLSLPADLRLCRMTPAPVLGEERKRLWAGRTNHSLQFLRMEYFRYRCAGQPYDEFMEQHLFPYVRQRHAADPNLQWGRRSSIVPPLLPTTKTTTSRSILVVGNSHTQQMVGALLCQFQEQALKSLQLQPKVENGVEYRFQNGLRIFVLINHGSVYSSRWKENLEAILGRRLDKMDAIVLGQFNSYDPKYDHSKLWQQVKQYGRDFVDYEIDVHHHPGGFGLADLARQFAGGIVWVSMAAANAQSHHHTVVAQMENITRTTGRTNLYAVNARRLIVSGYGGAECSSDSKTVVATCATKTADFVYSNGHKCMGDKGGEPDLVAYDVVEALHEALSARGAEIANEGANRSDGSDTKEGGQSQKRAKRKQANLDH